jgi:TonB family protein
MKTSLKIIALLVCMLESVSGKDLSPAQRAHKTAIYAARPDYPIEARHKHMTGAGVFAMHIRRDGTVSSVSIIRSTGHKILDKAAIDAFIQWRFWPGTVTTVRTPINFSMKGARW